MTLAGQAGVVTKNPGWYGKLVQWFTLSPAYHCVFVVVNDDGLEELVSPESPRVRIRPIGYFEGVEYTDVEYADEAHRDAAVRFARAQLTKPYSWTDIGLLVIARILRRQTPTVIKRSIREQSQWFCSELADAALQAGGVDLFPGRPDQAVVPADFLKVIRAEQAEAQG